MSDFLDTLPRRYRLILCDLWGCVHNGVTILPGVTERLDRWKAEGGTIIFLTNAPRPASAVIKQLAALGLPDRLNGSIVTSGDTALAWMAKQDRQWRSTFIGSQTDAQGLENAGVRLVREEDADTVICSGFDERGFELAAYAAQLSRLAERQVEMLCLNPDRVVHRGVTVEPCAGAIAESYRELGGAVRLFGKPHREVYEHAIAYSGRSATGSDRRAIVAIGDSIATDFVGAANAGIDFVFVSGGIERDSFRANAEQLFDDTVGLKAGPARPVAIVPALGAASMENSIQ